MDIHVVSSDDDDEMESPLTPANARCRIRAVGVSPLAEGWHHELTASLIPYASYSTDDEPSGSRSGEAASNDGMASPKASHSASGPVASSSAKAKGRASLDDEETPGSAPSHPTPVGPSASEDQRLQDHSLLAVSSVQVPLKEVSPEGLPRPSGSAAYASPPLAYNDYDLGDMDGDFGNLLRIQRLSSQDILYEERRKPPKLVGKYLFGEVLGEGSYGRVKECLDSHSLARRAVKIMKKSKLRRIPGGPENVATELRLLARLHHPNVIHLVETFERPEKGKLYLVMEFCVMSLQELSEGAPLKRLPVWQAHGYFRQLVDGLEYIHSQGVVHKDVKPGNLLLAVDESVKISDFGVAEEFDLHSGSDRSRLGQGTPKFQAPEIASGKSRSFHAFPLDCWSSGVTLYWLTTGEYPFDAESILKLYENIVQQPLVLPDLLDDDPALQAFLRELLEKDPRKRLSVDGMKGHAWLRRKPPCSRHGKVSMESVKPSAGEVTSVYPELLAMFDDDDATPPPGPSQDLLAEFEAEVSGHGSVHRDQSRALAAAGRAFHASPANSDQGSAIELSFGAKGPSNGSASASASDRQRLRRPEGGKVHKASSDTGLKTKKKDKCKLQ